MYAIDGVENITSQTETQKGVAKTVAFDVNDRNQITAYADIPLSYDVNGNLKNFIDSNYYDWKNQLVRVECADGRVVDLKYDALGRRIEKSVQGGDSTAYVYDGWRVIEERDGTNALVSRYAYGNGIDELLEIEKEGPVSGEMESFYPAQITNGSVVAVTDAEGELVEKVRYAAYGNVRFLYDHEGPEVEVVRIDAGNLRIRFSEAVKTDGVGDAVTVEAAAGPVSGSFVFEDEDRVAVFTPNDPLPQEELTLTVTTDLEDLQGNTLETEFTQVLTYAGVDLNIFDRAAPEVMSIRLINGDILVGFNEEVEAASIAGAVALQNQYGSAAGVVTLEDAKTLKFDPDDTLSNGTDYTVTVNTYVQDLSGKALAQADSEEFTYTGDDLTIKAEKTPGEEPESYIGNSYLFQGRDRDPDTGLYYFRARYLHPELGRFLQGDPKGYVDSMNLYQGFGNDPINAVDPYGSQYEITVSPQGASDFHRLNAYEFCRMLKEQGYSPEEIAKVIENSIYANELYTGRFLESLKKQKAAEQLDTSFLKEWGNEIGKDVDKMAFGMALPFLYFKKGILEDRPDYLAISGGMIVGEALLSVAAGEALGLLASKFPVLTKSIRLGSSKAGLRKTQGLKSFESGRIFEAEKIAKLGKQKSTRIIRPTFEDTESSAFKLIVGETKFTKSGALKGTIFDVSEGGYIEIKSGLSTLSSSYQIRLQTYFSLKSNTPYTIISSRPINPTFLKWLKNWGVLIK